MPTDKDRSWTSLYKDAMLEFDPQRLRERISLENNAIKQRLARQLHLERIIDPRSASAS